MILKVVTWSEIGATQNAKSFLFLQRTDHRGRRRWELIRAQAFRNEIYYLMNMESLFDVSEIFLSSDGDFTKLRMPVSFYAFV